MAAAFGRSNNPPVFPAAALAALKARSVLAAPQAEVRKVLLECPRRFEFSAAASCARRLASRFAGHSGTGANSPFEVLSSLMGRRLPSGSLSCMVVPALIKSRRASRRRNEPLGFDMTYRFCSAPGDVGLHHEPAFPRSPLRGLVHVPVSGPSDCFGAMRPWLPCCSTRFLRKSRSTHELMVSRSRGATGPLPTAHKVACRSPWRRHCLSRAVRVVVAAAATDRDFDSLVDSLVVSRFERVHQVVADPLVEMLGAPLGGLVVGPFGALTGSVDPGRRAGATASGHIPDARNETPRSPLKETHPKCTATVREDFHVVAVKRVA